MAECRECHTDQAARPDPSRDRTVLYVVQHRCPCGHGWCAGGGYRPIPPPQLDLDDIGDQP